MARKNKKKMVNGFIFPIPYTGFAVLISTLALGYVWLGCRCEFLGSEIKTLEFEKTFLNKKYLSEECKWTRMKSPLNIERVLKEHNIVMTWPRQDQVVRIYDSGAFPDMSIETADDVLGYAKLERGIMND